MITPQEFADKHLGEYKVRGEEIVPKYCPYCGGGDRKNRESFGMNINTGVFNCKRGKCAVAGTFWRLCVDFGEKVPNPLENKKKKKKYKKPQEKINPPTSLVEEYLQKRKLSKETWQRLGIGEHKGNIVFPYYEYGHLVMYKFRPAKKLQDGEQKSWRSKDGKPVFWNMDLCSTDKPLIIVEGELDCVALYEAGLENVVSVPSGAKDLTCVDLCWEWLQKFSKIIIWPDNDEPGQEMGQELVRRLGAWRCHLVKSERKDANEVLYFDGKEEIENLVNNAEEVGMDGLIRLAEVKQLDYENAVKIPSGIKGLDREIDFLLGETSVWTGINSSGKSTLLGQILLETIENEFPVCALSGELPSPIFAYWINLQAAGPQHLEMKYNTKKEKEVAYVKKEVLPLIQQWYYDYFWLYDSRLVRKKGKDKEKYLFDVFEYAARRYNVKVFLIDNLMTTLYARDDKDFYRRQSEFISDVVDFGKDLNVHIHVVAHPRKTIGRLTKMDVSGTGDITNLADKVFGVHRLKPDEKQEDEYGFDSYIDVFKDRMEGNQDFSVGLYFDNTCKRFYMEGEQYKQYSWINYAQPDDKQETLPWD